MDIIDHNRRAWNREAAAGGEWSRPVDAEVIRRARDGDVQVILTPRRPVPRTWLGKLRDREVLCLASGGGQQAPVLAAAGAVVTSLDLAEEQLARDRMVAEREQLSLRCVQGDMRDLSDFEDAGFDLVFHPVSNLFIPELGKVWRECYRVLRPGGVLLAGFMNPAYFLFDHDEAARSGLLTVRHSLPYHEPESLGPKAKARWRESGAPAQFSHSLEAQIGGQLRAGFILIDCYEDGWSDDATPLNGYAPVAMATKAIKLPAELKTHFQA